MERMGRRKSLNCKGQHRNIAIGPLALDSATGREMGYLRAPRSENA